MSTYRPFVGSSYIDLPIELKYPKKGLINIKYNDQKCFLWCHVRHHNLLKEHPEKLKKLVKRLLVVLIRKRLSFLQKKKILKRLKYKIIFVLMCIVMKMRRFFQFMFLIKHLKAQ